MKSAKTSSNKNMAFQYLQQPWNVFQKFRKAKVLTVEPAMLMFLLGRTFLLSLSQHFFFFVTASKNLQNSSFPLSNGSFCLDSSTLNNYSEHIYRNVMSESNHLVAVTQVAGSLTAITVTILSVPLLKRYGYRLGILLPTLGNIVKGVILFLFTYYQLNPYWFIAASLVGGLSGDVCLFLTSCFTYISHVSSTKWLTMRLAIGEAAANVGEGTGQLLLGYWLQKSNCSYLPLIQFYTASSVFIVIYIILLVPEALTASQRGKSAQENSKEVCKFWHGLHQIFTSSFSKAWRMLVSLMYISVSDFVVTGGLVISLYFLKAMPFDYNAFYIGIVQSMQSLSRALSNTVLVAIMVLLEIPDTVIMLLALLVSSISVILLGLARKNWQVYTVFVIQGVDIIGWAGAEGFMSKLLSPSEQGSLFAIITSVQGISVTLAGFVWPYIFTIAINYSLPIGLPYFLMGGLGILILPFIILLLICKMDDNNMTQPSPTKDKNTPCHDDCEDTEKSDEHTKFLSDSVGSE